MTSLKSSLRRRPGRRPARVGVSRPVVAVSAVAIREPLDQASRGTAHQRTGRRDRLVRRAGHAQGQRGAAGEGARRHAARTSTSSRSWSTHSRAPTRSWPRSSLPPRSPVPARDGWMVEAAESFNASNQKLADGRDAKVAIRRIASGTGYQFIAAGDDLPGRLQPLEPALGRDGRDAPPHVRRHGADRAQRGRHRHEGRDRRAAAREVRRTRYQDAHRGGHRRRAGDGLHQPVRLVDRPQFPAHRARRLRRW